VAADKGLFERIRKSFDSKRDEAPAIHPSENKYKLERKFRSSQQFLVFFKLVTQQQQQQQQQQQSGRPSMNERTCAFFFLSVTAAATCPIKTRTEMKHGDN